MFGRGIWKHRLNKYGTSIQLELLLENNWVLGWWLSYCLWASTLLYCILALWDCGWHSGNTLLFYQLLPFRFCQEGALDSASKLEEKGGRDLFLLVCFLLLTDPKAQWQLFTSLEKTDVSVQRLLSHCSFSHMLRTSLIDPHRNTHTSHSCPLLRDMAQPSGAPPFCFQGLIILKSSLCSPALVC